jgi:glycolate oxidase iron-sulfur subunit
VHCGFCLQACPTYVNLEDENDSPRGRLVLMRRMLDGEIALTDPTAAQHIDRCLGCRGCETACPSGVPYGQLLEATRATMAQQRPLPVISRLILWVFSNHPLLHLSLTIAGHRPPPSPVSCLAQAPGVPHGDVGEHEAEGTPTVPRHP